MNDFDIERMEQELQAAITERDKAIQIRKEVYQEARADKELLNQQMRAHIRQQMNQDSQAISVVGRKIDVQGERVNNLQHAVTDLQGTIEDLRKGIISTASIDVIYADKERECITRYNQLKHNKELEYERFCKDIDQKKEQYRNEAKTESAQLEASMQDRKVYLQTELDDLKIQYKILKKKRIRFIVGWVIAFICALVCGYLVGMYLIQ